MINHDTDPTKHDPVRGEVIAGILIGFMVIAYIVWAMWQAHRGHGSGMYFERFMQNMFSCCAVDEPGDVEKAAEMTGESSNLPIYTRGDHAHRQ